MLKVSLVSHTSEQSEEPLAGHFFETQDGGWLFRVQVAVQHVSSRGDSTAMPSAEGLAPVALYRETSFVLGGASPLMCSRSVARSPLGLLRGNPRFQM